MAAWWLFSLFASISVYIFIYERLFLDNPTDDTTQRWELENENRELKLINSKLSQDKQALEEASLQLQQNENTTLQWFDELQNEISELKLINSKIDHEKYALKTENKAFKNQRNIVVSNATQKYYLLLGYCPLSYGYEQYWHIIRQRFTNYVSENYPHWIMLNISVRSFLRHASENKTYSHQSLLNFTQTNAPFIDLNTDKFQWVFDPCCEKYYTRLDIKRYYNETANISLAMHMPPNASSIASVKYMISDRERKGMSHITNINNHKYWNSKVNQSYSINIEHSTRVTGVWQNNTYFGQRITYLQSLENSRPLLLGMTGEVFQLWRQSRNGAGVDVHIQRTKSWPRERCIVTSFIQGILMPHLPMDPVAFHSVDKMDLQRLIVSSDRNVEEIMAAKDKFCSFTIKALFAYGYYFSDALVRHAFRLLLSAQYKQCDMTGYYDRRDTDIHNLCRSENPKYKDVPCTFHMVPDCVQSYKFSINMENVMTYGYTSEKIYTGLLGDTIPIYFGNNDIGDIVNLDRIVHCKMDERVLVQARNEWGIARNDILKNKLNLTEPYQIGRNGTIQEWMDPFVREWAVHTYGPHLQDCIGEVIEIDSNDTLYKWKLSQPTIPHNSVRNSHYDGSVVSRSIIDTMKYLKSPLFD